MDKSTVTATNGYKRIVRLIWIFSCAIGLTGAGAEMSAAGGCTSFCLCGDGRAIVGKNLDWSIEEGVLCLNPRGLHKKAFVDSTERALEWVSTYASVSFNQLGREFPLGGMNEAGLVVEELAYWPSRFPPPDERPVVNELQWIQYQLDAHASVAEVIERGPDVSPRPLLFGLHYFVADASGDAAVIEFLNGKRIVHHGSGLPIPVLTNDTYKNSVRYLSNFTGFGGTLSVSDGHESPERFVRAATMLREFERGRSSTDPVPHAFAILASTAQEDTQWSIVYDAGERTVRFRTASVPAERIVRLAALDPECDGPILALDLSDPRDGDIGEYLAPWSPEDQERLVSGVLARLAGERIVEDRLRERFQKALVRYGSVVPRCEGVR